MDYSPPGSSVLGFTRQEYWSGLPFPSPGDLETNIMLYVSIPQLKKKNPGQMPPCPGELACFHRPDVTSLGHLVIPALGVPLPTPDHEHQNHPQS